MPIISQFYGIIIRMFRKDHEALHFHASYGEHELLVGIEPSTILEGHAPPRVRSMVVEWAVRHQSELLQNWERCRRTQAPHPVEPLE